METHCLSGKDAAKLPAFWSSTLNLNFSAVYSHGIHNWLGETVYCAALLRVRILSSMLITELALACQGCSNLSAL